jgi:hypothetical protein
MNYVKIENNIATQVIVAEESFFETFIDTTPGEWIQSDTGNVGDEYIDGIFNPPYNYNPDNLPDATYNYQWNHENNTWIKLVEEK